MKNVQKVKGANPYRVRMKVNGVRKSKYFPTKEAAIAQLKVWKAEAMDTVSSEEIAELIVCRNKLAGKGSLSDAVDFFLAHGVTERNAPNIREGAEKFLGWILESGRSLAYQRSTRSLLSSFVARFGDTVPSVVTNVKFADWVRLISADAKYTPQTKHAQVRTARIFLGWARAQGWCDHVPVVDDWLLPRREIKEPEYYTAAETRRLFALLEAHEPTHVLHFAVRAFLGLRRSEANRLTWDDVDLENKIVRVRARKTKLGVARTLDLDLVPPTAFEWMAAYRGTSGFACNYDGVVSRLRGLFRFKRNAFRKTFATMLTSLTRSQQATMLATGHTSVVTLKKHYEGAKQSREEAEAYFAVRPTKGTRGDEGD